MSDNDSSAGPDATIITPQDIRAPKRASATGGSSGISKGCLFFGVFLVLVFLFAAMGYMLLRLWFGYSIEPPPVQVADPVPVAVPAVTNAPAKPPKPDIDPAELLLNRERAEEALADFVKKKNALDELAVLEWGGKEFAEVLAKSKAADRYFLQEKFPDATRAYEEAIGLCDMLLAQKDEALGIVMQAGKEALAELDGITARHKFKAALKIDPDHAPAQKGLKRAGTLAQVLKLMESGKEKEQRRLYAMALTDYQEAATLDPDFSDAQSAVQRMHAAIREIAFQEKMSEGFALLRAGDIPGAEAVFAQAAGLRADAPEIKEALLQVEEAKKLARIKALKAEAETAEQEEGWTIAFEKYREALAIDANLQFARAGKERAAAIVRLGKHMQYYLDKPERLSTGKGRTDAALVLEDARAVADPGPAFSGMVEQFSRLVKAATTKVQVILESDGLTSVDVYKVGRFGSFEQKILDLLPGTYTVVGARNGYRDVRIQLVVPAGSEEIRTTVICKEKI